MVTDYDVSRKNEDEAVEDSIEKPKSRRNDAGSAEVEEDENEAAEDFELPGADLLKEELAIHVILRQEDKFTCSWRSLVHHASQLDHVDANGAPMCTECAMRGRTMFGCKKETVEEEIEEVETLPHLSDEDVAIWSEPDSRNYGEVDTNDGYIDVGSILFLTVQGMQLRIQVADGGTTVLQILVVLGNSGIQMSVTAILRSGDAWEELREEIRKGFEGQGAKVADYPTCYDSELLVDTPIQMPDGRSATSRMRIIGRESDRWFTHIDILGPAVATTETDADIEKVIGRIVAHRGDYPRAHLELLPVHLPAGARET